MKIIRLISSIPVKTMRRVVLQKELERQRFSLPFHLVRLNQSQTGQGEVAHDGELSPLAASSANQATSNATGDREKSEDLSENPFYNKYAEKIKAAQAKQQSSPQENGNKDMSKPVDAKIIEEKVQQMNSLEQSFNKTSGQGKDAKPISSRKSLDDIVHLDKLANLTPEEIEEVWRTRHSSQKDTIYSILKSSEYDLIYENATKYPLFILPLPKSTAVDAENKDGQQTEGYQMFLSRFAQHTFYLTPLAMFQQLQDAAVPSLVINHFPELSSSKQIVLLNGTFDSGHLNIIEVQCLANQIKLFYCTSDPARLLLLHKINCEPGKFDHMEVIEQLERQL